MLSRPRPRSRGRVIVVGGDAAGMSAASELRRRQSDVEIVVFERGPHTSYSACGIPYLVAGAVARPEDLVVRSPEEFARRGIDARVLHEVVAIDPWRRQVRVRPGAGGALLEERYDELVIATGARPVRPGWPGIDAEGIHTVATLADGIQVREAVDREGPARAVVVGGGYIGLEMAEALAARGLTVTLVEQRAAVMSGLDLDMGELVSSALVQLGVELRLGERARGFHARNGRVVAVDTDRASLPADLVILAAGVEPNVELARAAGIPLGPTGAIKVNARMQTAIDGVWAAGDCAESFHLVSRRPVFAALGTIANKQGRVCGINLGGGYATFPGIVGTVITRIGATEVARTGLADTEARSAGISAVSGTARSTLRAPYFTEPGEITVKVLAERRTGRLLGAQVVGTASAAKRIDVVAAALTGRLTAEQLAYADLGYVPPLGTVWDPLQIAARRAMEEA